MSFNFLKTFKNPWEATGEKVRNSGVLRNVVDEWAEKNQKKILGQADNEIADKATSLVTDYVIMIYSKEKKRYSFQLNPETKIGTVYDANGIWNGTDIFVTAVRKALEQIAKSETGLKIILALQSKESFTKPNGYTVEITEIGANAAYPVTVNGFVQNKKGKYSLVFWDNINITEYVGFDKETNKTVLQEQYPFMALAHELAHAYDDFLGTYDLTIISNDWTDFPKAEYFASFLENQINHQFGFILRTHYTYVTITDPVTNESIKVPAIMVFESNTIKKHAKNGIEQKHNIHNFNDITPTDYYNEYIF